MLASKKDWGQCAWNFMHIIACKIKPEEFVNQKEHILNIIIGICTNVPCKDCRDHAVKQINKLRFSSIRTREDLIYMLHDFHNKVNVRTQKSLYKREDLKVYEEMSTREVVHKFFETWTLGSSTPRLMMDTFARVQLLKYIREYFNSHAMKYNA